MYLSFKLRNGRHLARSSATRIQLPPTVLRKSLLHLAGAFYTTFTETWSPLQNSFTPAVVSSNADMANPRSYEEGLYLYNIHNTVEKHFRITIAPVRSRDMSLVYHKSENVQLTIIENKTLYLTVY
jgi:hypothetical protein